MEFHTWCDETFLYLARCIARLIILTIAIAWLSFTSLFRNCSRRFKKADLLSDAPIFSRKSDIKKPRSAMMLSFFPNVLHLVSK